MADRPIGTFKLWDKDFNLLATWKEDDDLRLTVDREGEGRWAGIVKCIDALGAPE